MRFWLILLICVGLLAHGVRPHAGDAEPHSDRGAVQWAAGGVGLSLTATMRWSFRGDELLRGGGWGWDGPATYRLQPQRPLAGLGLLEQSLRARWPSLQTQRVCLQV